MTRELKRRLLFAWLVLFALWPLVHHGLVRTYDMSPWKLNGWAMYCRPSLPVTMTIALLDGEEEIGVIGDQIPEPARVEVDRFQDRYPQLGDLAPPDAALEAILTEAPPSADGAVISVQKLELSPESDRLRVQMRRYELHR